MILFSFLFFLIGIVCLIGFLASRKSRQSEDDYFLASQNVSPYALAFSGSASKFSGFMFSGFMATAPETDRVAFIPQNLSIGGYSGWFLFFWEPWVLAEEDFTKTV